MALLFCLAVVGRAQSWAPIPLPAGATVPVNRTVDSLRNSFGFSRDGGDAYTLVKVSPSGVVTTLATVSSHGSPPSVTVYDFVFTELAVDAADNVYAATLSLSGVPRGQIVKVTPAGVVSTTAVTSGFTNRSPHRPNLTVDQQGNVFTVGVDGGIYEIKNDGTQATVASDFPWFYSTVGDFPNPPQGLTVDSDGNLYTTVTNLNLINLEPNRYAGPLKLLKLTEAPVIAFQPQGATIPFGTNRKLIVAAASSSPLTYQWYVNGVAIS